MRDDLKKRAEEGQKRREGKGGRNLVRASRVKTPLFPPRLPQSLSSNLG